MTKDQDRDGNYYEDAATEIKEHITRKLYPNWSKEFQEIYTKRQGQLYGTGAIPDSGGDLGVAEFHEDNCLPKWAMAYKGDDFDIESFSEDGCFIWRKERKRQRLSAEDEDETRSNATQLDETSSKKMQKEITKTNNKTLDQTMENAAKQDDQCYMPDEKSRAANLAERERDLKLGEEHLSIAKQQLKIDQDLLKIQQQNSENEAKQKADAILKERFSKNLEWARNDWFAQLALHQIHLQKVDKELSAMRKIVHDSFEPIMDYVKNGEKNTE